MSPKDTKPPKLPIAGPPKKECPFCKKKVIGRCWNKEQAEMCLVHHKNLNLMI